MYRKIHFQILGPNLKKKWRKCGFFCLQLFKVQSDLNRKVEGQFGEESVEEEREDKKQGQIGREGEIREEERIG